MVSIGEPCAPSSMNRAQASGEGILALPELRPDILHRAAEASGSSWRQQQGEPRWRCNVGGKIDRHTLEGPQPEFSPAFDMERKYTPTH